MRVMLLYHRLPYPVNNGGRMRMVHLTRQLARAYEVRVLCPQASDTDLAGLRAVLGPPIEVTPAPWSTVHDRGSLAAWLSPLPRDVYRGAPGSSARRFLDRWLDHWTPDLLLATDPVLGEYVRPYPQVRRMVDIAAEYVLYLRRGLRLQPTLARPYAWLRILKWAAYMRSLHEHVDVWTVPSSVDRAALLKLLRPAAHVSVVPNGVDIALNPYSLVADAPLCLAHCGSLSYEPNRDALVYFCDAIWPRVLDHAPEVKLMVTGESSGAPAAVRQAPNLVMTGYLPDVRSVIQACRAEIVPLRLGVGTRLKIMEAMALGTPVVSTSVGAEGLEVTHGQDILLADDPAAFADSVVKVLHSPALRLRLSEAGRKLVEQRYAWDVIGDGLRAVVRGDGR